MSKHQIQQPSQKKALKQKGIKNWIEHRLPIFSFINKELVEYQTPKNLNFFWNTGSLSGITLLIMIITGIFLAMQYTPHVDHAFESVERIMREVRFGWLIRYIHMNGASMFFIVIYLHIFRGIYYGSYKSPRELLWIIGVIIFFLMMATAFMGYVLPWGQMSFWGATVITNFFTAFDINFTIVDHTIQIKLGTTIMEWLLGGYSVANPTLNRFFVLHYLLPFVIVAFVVLHLVALHQHGSNNPLGIDATNKSDKVPFHPYYTYKDLYGLGIFFTIWAIFVFFAPNFFGEPDNYLPADPLVTPTHIVPEWYFLPFYAILRSVPNKLAGVLLMFSSIAVLAALPWLDKSPVRSAKFRPIYKKLFWLLVISCLTLGWVGSQPPEGIAMLTGRIATTYYFAHFFIVLPLLSIIERPMPIPSSISQYEKNKQKHK